MASPEFSALRQRVSELRRRLLPSKWPLVASQAQSERARAFTVLAHAEVETYLESAVLAYVNRRFAEWDRSSKVSVCIVGLAKTAVRDVKEPDKDPRALREVVKLGRDQLAAYIATRNHGVREKQLKRLFLPLGIELRSLPLGLSQSLEAWGARRGGYAHAGGYVSIQNPKSEYDDVRDILRLLHVLDRTLSK